MNSAIELVDVGWEADRSFALQDVSLRVPVGSIYGFLGPNGSGKTTTIRLFMGMLKPDRGTISVFGRSVPRDMKKILARCWRLPPDGAPASSSTASRASCAGRWRGARLSPAGLSPGGRLPRAP